MKYHQFEEESSVVLKLQSYLILIVDNKRTTFLNTSAIPHLAFACPKALRLVYLFDVGPGFDLLQEDMGFLGLVVRLDLVGHNQGDFRNLFNTMSLSHHKGRNSSGSNGGTHSIPLLGNINLAMPTAVDLGRGKHMSATAHVSESTLAGAVSTTTTNTRDSGNSSTSSPGLGASLVTLNSKERLVTVLSKEKSACSRALP